MEIIPTPRAPVPVDHLAAIPPDLGTRPIPPHRPCHDPLTCGIHDLCPPCQDVEDWKALERKMLAERERLNPALREFQSLCRHHPHLIADELMRLLAEPFGEIVETLTGGGNG
jgi:hypothetical protein